MKRMTAFHYWSGEEVRVGDRIRSHGWPGTIEMVILPGTEDSEAYSCPEGGVMVLEDWGRGVANRILEIPPDGKCWEDLDFVERG